MDSRPIAIKLTWVARALTAAAHSIGPFYTPGKGEHCTMHSLNQLSLGLGSVVTK